MDVSCPECAPRFVCLPGVRAQSVFRSMCSTGMPHGRARPACPECVPLPPLLHFLTPRGLYKGGSCAGQSCGVRLKFPLCCPPELRGLWLPVGGNPIESWRRFIVLGRRWSRCVKECRALSWLRSENCLARTSIGPRDITHPLTELYYIHLASMATGIASSARAVVADIHAKIRSGDRRPFVVYFSGGLLGEVGQGVGFVCFWRSPSRRTARGPSKGAQSSKLADHPCRWL